MNNIPSAIYNEVSQLCRSLKVSTSLEACVEKIVRALQIKRDEKCLQQRFFVDPSPAPISRLLFRFRRNVARLLAGPFAADIVCELELHSFDTVYNNVAASNATTAHSIVHVSSFFTHESGLWGPTSLCTTKNSFILVRNLTSAKMMIRSTSANVFENVNKRGNTIGSETGRLCTVALLIILYEGLQMYYKSIYLLLVVTIFHIQRMHLILILRMLLTTQHQPNWPRTQFIVYLQLLLQ